MSIETLLAAASQVDVIDAAGRIIANPMRHAPSAKAGEVLALAHAVEKFWGLAIDAETLAHAHQRAHALRAAPLDPDNRFELAECVRRIEALTKSTIKQMAAIRGETPKE